MGDPARLRQVLFNLVGNAVKFTEQARWSCPRARRGARGRGVRCCTFTVRDTGIGIAAEKQSRLIFEAFEQADS